MKNLTLNNLEEKRKQIFRRLKEKMDDAHVPTAYERFLWLFNFLFPYLKTIRILMTIFTPSKFSKC
jgi:hypothetical protein